MIRSFGFSSESILANEFTAPETSAGLPIVTDFDPGDLVKILASGECHESIKKRTGIGAKSLEMVDVYSFGWS
jgi:hypothetical protein